LEIEETALWNFALVFVASDLENLDSVEEKQKAKRFLLQRLQLLQKTYGSLPEEEDTAKPLIQRFIWRLKRSELELLKMHEEKVAKLQY
jgi:hypothetical protein